MAGFAFFPFCDDGARGSVAEVAGLEYSSGKTAEVVGKPSADFFAAALRDVGGQVRGEEQPVPRIRAAPTQPKHPNRMHTCIASGQHENTGKSPE